MNEYRVTTKDINTAKLHSELTNAGINVITIRGKHMAINSFSSDTIIVHDGVVSDSIIQNVVDTHVP